MKRLKQLEDENGKLTDQDANRQVKPKLRDDRQEAASPNEARSDCR